jgi:tRNA (adenine58-N1)-methyltransferase non-catalytic subunit
MTETARTELFEGDFDGLIISSEYDSFSIIQRLLPYLAGSATVVVHNPVLQPLMETFARMRVMPDFVRTMVTEPWMRKYQVLPGRMHPEMSTSATGGYLLQSLRVLADADKAQEE